MILFWDAVRRRDVTAASESLAVVTQIADPGAEYVRQAQALLQRLTEQGGTPPDTAPDGE